MPIQPAILNIGKLNNFPLNYVPAALQRIREKRVFFTLGNDPNARDRIRVGSVTIQDLLNDAPNTASLVVDTTAPVIAQDFIVRLGADARRLLFAGTLQTLDTTYESKPTERLLIWPCTAIDTTALANTHRPLGTWINVSATDVAIALVQQFAPKFTTTNIATGLPPISISFDGSQTFINCLLQIAKLIGGYTFIEAADVYLYQNWTGELPDPVDVAHPPEADPPIKASVDLSQLRTRIYGKGAATTMRTDVIPPETIMPVDDAVMFDATGGHAVAGVTPDGGQSQVLGFTGTILGGVGTIVGPAVSPSAALTPTPAPGLGLVADANYQYAYTFATASGETRPSPLAAVRTSVAVKRAADPTQQCITNLASYNPYWANGRPGLDVGVVYQYYYTYQLRSNQGETFWSPVSAPIVPTMVGGDYRGIYVYSYTSKDPELQQPGACSIMIYRSRAGAPFKFIWYFDSQADWSTFHSVQFADYGEPDATGASSTPGPYPEYPLNAAILPTTNQVALSGVGVGPSGTTGRKVYRTIANGSQLKLQQTIPNNTATVGVTDATSDGSLGANAPTGDSSGLSAATGQVNPGSPTLNVANSSVFPASGGWVESGNQMIRYQAVTGNDLTGIPASGIGAITNMLKFGDHVDLVDALVGLTGLTRKLASGSNVNIWVQRDDLTAQQAMKDIDAAQGRITDGVYEDLITDERRGAASLNDLCDANLKLYSRPIMTVTYATRDPKTKTGRPVAVTFTLPAISVTLMIQNVVIDQIGITPHIGPRFTVTASTVRFTLEDILRQMATVTLGGPA